MIWGATSKLTDFPSRFTVISESDETGLSGVSDGVEGAAPASGSSASLNAFGVYLFETRLIFASG